MRGDILYMEKIYSKEYSVVEFDMLKAPLDPSSGHHIKKVRKT